MRRTLLGLLCCLLVGSCSSPAPRPPADVLPGPRMQQLLWDMIRADSYLSMYLARDSGAKKLAESKQLYEEIFRIHHTSRDQFNKSLTYYKAHPDQFKLILDSLDVQKKRVLEQIYRPTRPDTSLFRRKFSLEPK
ncbi:MAG TPA: DUF4296 domain-containing protein [Chitinophagaceae bacterium]|nr:DUF4296 domain-containing protein [Chitinophagaceae bacterium]